MNALNVQDLYKSYGSRTVFDGVSFAVDEGEKVGFVGANGSGKSTLFRIVAGLEGYTAGTIAVRRDARVEYLAQEPIFDAGATVRTAAAGGMAELQGALAEFRTLSEQLAAAERDGAEPLLARQGALAARIEALGGWDAEHRVEAMLTRLGVQGWERPVEQLSGGEQKRVALARVLLQQPEVLLLDEPTNHLDVDTTQWLEEHLAGYPGAVLLITHDRYFLDRVVSRMIEVSTGELTGYPGGYEEYLEAKAARMERLEAEQAKRARLIEQELEWVRRSPSARTGKQKARIQRLDALQQGQRAEALPARAVADMQAGAAPRLGRTVVNLHAVSKRFGDRVLIDGFSTMLQAGERIGVLGPNGAGKTTLVRIIVGEEPPTSGEVEIGVNTRIAYFNQTRDQLDPNATLLESVSDTDWVTVGGARIHARSYLERFLFPPAAQRQVVRTLSGGERNRLLLARLFLQEANLLVLDEPTNDLDLLTLQVLESLLADFGGCVLVITHDRFFLDKVATGLIVFEGDGVLRRHAGGYELYRRLREQREAEQPVRTAAAPRKTAAAPAAPKRAAGPRRLTYRETREWEGMEEAILAAEADKEALAAPLADPALYRDEPERVAALREQFEAAAARVDELYTRWAELEEIRGGVQ